MKKENEEPCCGNCVSFTNESFMVMAFAAIKKNVQIVENVVININTDNYDNRRKTG